MRESYIELLNWCRANNVTGITGGRVIESPNGKTIVLPLAETLAVDSLTLPFWPNLITNTSGENATYSVTLTDGWVSEIIPGTSTPAAPANAFHKPFNLLWGSDAVSPDTATDRRRFDLSIGDQISVVVYMDDEGGFGGELAPAGGPVEIVIEPEESSGSPVSVHYNPPGGDVTTGDSGAIHYKLAVLRDIDADHSEPWLEYFLAGSHINTQRDLPMLENTSASGSAGTGRVFKEYKPEDNQYKFRTISKGAGQLQVNENADEIEVRGNDKSPSLIFMQETDASPEEIDRVSFEDGLVNESEDVTITLPKPLPAAWWGTIVFMYGDGSRQGTLTFENGRLMQVDYGDDRVVIEGTEASPGTHGIIVAAS